MNVLRANKCLLAFVFLLMTVFGLAHVSLARDINGLPKGSSIEVLQNNGQVGLGRIRADQVGSKATLKSFKLRKGVIPNVNPTAIVYAAYTSYTNENDSNTYWAWVYPDEAYLFVAFRVTNKTKVKVNWEIEGPDGVSDYQEEIEDSEESGGLLNPDYWYFAWWKPVDSLSVGIYDYLATVKPFPIGRRGKDSCQFEVVGN
ncbi:MAG: hypothetical protein HS132_06785 [Planctomycetia bacterium]|nr:hypothetical protein [Planctomycetia bacterium]